MAFNLAVCTYCGKQIHDGQYYRIQETNGDRIGQFVNICPECNKERLDKIYGSEDAFKEDRQVLFEVGCGDLADFELSFDPCTQKYYISIETIYEFTDEYAEYWHYMNIVCQFMGWMCDNGYVDESECNLGVKHFYNPLDMFNRRSAGFDTVNEAYDWFVSIIASQFDLTKEPECDACNQCSCDECVNR